MHIMTHLKLYTKYLKLKKWYNNLQNVNSGNYFYFSLAIHINAKKVHTSIRVNYTNYICSTNI